MISSRYSLKLCARSAPLAVTALLLATPSQSVPTQFTGGGISNGYYYELVDLGPSGANRASARATALASSFNNQTGRLAAIYDSALSNFITNTLIPSVSGITSGDRAWTSGHDELFEGTFVWQDHGNNLASTAGFTNFATGQPDDAGSGEDFISLFLTAGRVGQWNDDNGGTSLRYALIEYSPLPVTIPLSLPLIATGVGALGLIARRRMKKEN